MKTKQVETMRDRSYHAHKARTHSQPAIWVHIFSPYTMYSQLVPFCNASGHHHDECRAELHAALSEGGILKTVAMGLA